MAGQTSIAIHGEDFWINGAPTYSGRTWMGHRIEGLLLNSRMVQATFDDLNPDTRARWAYPDTGRWDPERNIQEFLDMLPVYRQHGLLAVTVNCQGGSPEGYSRAQPWENSAFSADGALRTAYADRLRRVIEAADACGMVVIVGYFYQGQDERLRDEAAVLRAVDEATDFLLSGGWTNIMVEVMNCHLKEAACSSGCESVFPPVHLTDPKIDVWPHDIGPDTQPESCVSRRYERSGSTQTFLPSEGFIARTGKRSVGKVRATAGAPEGVSLPTGRVSPSRFRRLRRRPLSSAC